VWCAGVVVWWSHRNAVTDSHCEIRRKYTAVRRDTPVTPIIPTLRNFGAALAKGAGSRPAGWDILCLLRSRRNVLMIRASLLIAINFVDVCSFPRK